MGELGKALSARYNGEIRVKPVIMVGWFVCPTVSMMITSRAASLEKTLYIEGYRVNCLDLITDKLPL